MNIQLLQGDEVLPEGWDTIVGHANVLLHSTFLSGLSAAMPSNVKLYTVAFFNQNNLIGGAVVQHFNTSRFTSFQEGSFRAQVKNYFINKVVGEVVVVGNNMITGMNAYSFVSGISDDVINRCLRELTVLLYKRFPNMKACILKDFYKGEPALFNHRGLKGFHSFLLQPNMVFKLRKEWESYEDYIASFSKKYRSRAKVARQKLKRVSREVLSLSDLKKWQDELFALYQNVAKNASFNTFVLPDNHFYMMKQSMGDKFVVYGYFLDGQLVGFCTMIVNESIVETYFLGYRLGYQRELKLYLNMLLDMVAYAILQRKKVLNFGRTALEIKSTIGAEPVEMYVLIQHRNRLINLLLKKVFKYINPTLDWVQRRPFKK